MEKRNKSLIISGGLALCLIITAPSNLKAKVSKETTVKVQVVYASNEPETGVVEKPAPELLPLMEKLKIFNYSTYKLLEFPKAEDEPETKGLTKPGLISAETADTATRKKPLKIAEEETPRLTRTVKMPFGQKKRILLPDEELYLELWPLGAKGKMVKMKVSILKIKQKKPEEILDPKPVLATNIKVPQGKTFFLGGPPYEKGVLIIPITVELK